MPSLRDCQVSSFQKILNLNRETADADANGSISQTGAVLDPATGEPIWKVLVFDDMGRDAISSVMRVNDLRSYGVTIHLHIKSQRHPIPDVPVLYLVEPTEENVRLIVSDLSKNLYADAYVNFLSSVSRDLMESLANQIAGSGTSESIAAVWDQYLNFVVAEPDLFTLAMGTDTFFALNSNSTPDSKLDAQIDRTVAALFSVCATMGSIPIIRCSKSGPSELVSQKLDRKLRDHILNSKDNLFSGSGSGQRPSSSSGASSSRPVLVVLDRSVDLIPMLSHSWTYQSLVHDVLRMRLNRITVETPRDESDLSKGTTKKAYDLNSNDFFWTKNAGMPFPQVAEDIDSELTKYKDEAADITKKTGASSLEDLQADAGNTPAAHLKEAITLLPALRERKATLDMHMNIATALLQGIKDRELDNYYELESTVTKQTKAQMLEFLNDTSKGGKQPLDKLRLFIIWYLSTESDVSRADMTKFEEALTKLGVDATPVQYVKGVREMAKMTMMASAPSQPAQQGAGSDLFKGFSSLSNRFTDRFKDNALGANFENLISGVKNLMPVNRDYTITKVLESIMDPTGASSSAIAKTENYLYFDPRSANARGTMPDASKIKQGQQAGGLAPGIQASFGQRRQAFSEAIVFVVGGGSMDEYGNLQEWVKRTTQAAGGNIKRRVVYGSDEIVGAEDFVEQMARLGRESG